VASNHALIEDHERRISRLEDETCGGSEPDRPITEHH